MKKFASLCALLIILVLPGPVYAQAVSGQVIIAAPPPVREEVITPAPGPAAQWVWHRGHWRWIDSSYVWVPGHWVTRPRPTAVWVEPSWRQRHHGWVFVEGHWK